MRKSIARLLIFLTGVGVIVFILLKEDPLKPIPALIIAVAVNIISAPLYVGIIEGIYNLRRLPLVIKSQLIYRNKDVRLSISYLFRIKSNGKYLLVKNRKYNYYQLVGGAYKALPGAGKVFKKYGVKPDNRFETDHGIAKNDLRFRVAGKNVFSMIRWFNSREDRETSQWREFCEELLTTNIIHDKYVFRFIDYQYATTIQTPIQKAKNLNCQEILIYEIFDLISNTEQEKVLDELYQKGNSEKVKWADEKLIQTLGFDERTKEMEYEIAPHTKWAVDEKYTKE
jgi:hypothetical protein